LELFQHAVNWKRTLRRHIQPHLRGDVLEVGAGIGGTTRNLRSGRETSWTCLEPDPQQARRIQESGLDVAVCLGTLSDLPASQRYDTVLYIDVLEHIEDDRAEVHAAVGRLRPGGSLVVLSPAHPFLYSAFDKSIGHYRRYTRHMLRELRPPGAVEITSRYLDSVGLLASAANRFLLSQSMPSRGQIAFWDRVIVRASRILDPVCWYRLGKTILVVWRNPGGESTGA
jgi:2-polyprenyl-3-methyl-5-hydroxy-6-metoxy-1,4-benzoquinol methylase